MLVFNLCEYVVLEAGLGGEYDATAVFKKHLTLVTPIDIDHEAFLGTTIQEIATTKLNAIENSAIIATQKYREVYSVCDDVVLRNRVTIYRVDNYLDSIDLQNVVSIAEELSLVEYLKDNLKLAISALEFLKIKYSSENFKNAKLFGRMSYLNKNIIVDVGHNVLAATAIAKALNGDKYILVYNSYRDKEYKKILQILKPIIKYVEIISIDDDRIATKQRLQDTLTELQVKYTTFKKIKKDMNYLVFGSFVVVETFIREYYE